MDSRYAAIAAAQSDTGSQRLTLPRPTGPYAVGRETLHLVDHTRPDPWMPEARARELMVSVYYPARAGTGRPAQYLTTTEAQLLLEDRGLGDTVPAKTLSGTRTTARTKARPVHGRYPLVVLSPASASTATPSPTSPRSWPAAGTPSPRWTTPMNRSAPPFPASACSPAPPARRPTA
jgi:hypothetical protein